MREKRSAVFGRWKRKEPSEPEAVESVTPSPARPLAPSAPSLLAVAPSTPPPVQAAPRVEQGKTTVLAEDTRVTGTIQTASAMLLEGELEGEITSADSIRVGRDAAIKGVLSAQSLEVGGRVDGEVRARRLRIGATGRVLANVTVERLAVDEGGVLEGRCRMTPT